MLEKMVLEPVKPLQLDFTQKESKSQLERDVEKAANQSFLTTFGNEGLFGLYGSGADLLFARFEDAKFKRLYLDKLAFWLERSIRNDIVNIQNGKAWHNDKSFLEQRINFYKNVFIDGNKVDLLVHKMLDADYIRSHDHVKDDKILIF